ncbi:MAG: type II toxin-antitoxin system RelB/DinJ family antitoxin [Caulobacteraceae bacterium]|nr:type II toxin-antitoxin system RelB/DinJ family antitoxin [Caulobacter sp.]
MPAEAVVRARIDEATKASATSALEAMGLTVSDAIRLLLRRVAEERRLPFELREPNAASEAAMRELDAGAGRRHADVAALFDDLAG